MKIGYGEITKKSFSVAKKAKWLWIYGVILASSGSGYNLSRSISSQDMENISTSVPNIFGGLEKIFTTWASQLTTAQISTFFGSIAVFAIFSFVIKLVLDSWAQSSMIYGVDQALEAKEVTLSNTSPVGLTYFKSNIVLQLISFVMSLGLMLAIIIPSAILIAISLALKIQAVSVIVGVLAVVAFVYLLISLTGASIYGIRLIVLKNYTPWNAWKDGFKLARKHPLRIVLTSFISNFLGGAVTLVGLLVSLFVLGLPVYLLLSPLVVGSQSFSLMPVLPSLVLFFVFIWFNAALSGAAITFKTAFWNQFFDKIWKEK